MHGIDGHCFWLVPQPQSTQWMDTGHCSILPNASLLGLHHPSLGRSSSIFLGL